MAEVLLFHHALGLTPGVLEFAERLRAARHTVHTPDLFDGSVFENLHDGLAHAQEVGLGEVRQRGVLAAVGLPDELVYLGFSLGVMPAQELAQTRPGTRGAILCESCIPPTEFGAAWPAGVPVQVHGMDSDPVFAGEGDLEAARTLVEQADDGELFLYPGATHLFADAGLPSFDGEAMSALTHRVLAFLDRV